MIVGRATLVTATTAGEEEEKKGLDNSYLIGLTVIILRLTKDNENRSLFREPPKKCNPFPGHFSAIHSLISRAHVFVPVRVSIVNAAAP